MSIYYFVQTSETNECMVGGKHFLVKLNGNSIVQLKRCCYLKIQPYNLPVRGQILHWYPEKILKLQREQNSVVIRYVFNELLVVVFAPGKVNVTETLLQFIIATSLKIFRKSCTNVTYKQGFLTGMVFSMCRVVHIAVIYLVGLFTPSASRDFFLAFSIGGVFHVAVPSLTNLHQLKFILQRNLCLQCTTYDTTASQHYTYSSQHSSTHHLID